MKIGDLYKQNELFKESDSDIYAVISITEVVVFENIRTKKRDCCSKDEDVIWYTEVIPKSPMELIMQVRYRQIYEFGYTSEHDDQYTAGQLLYFASRYLENNEPIKAAALIVAELERKQRNENC